MAEDKISYSDIIQPDNSLERLINQLDQVNKHYGELISTVQTSAKQIADTLKTVTSASDSGKKEISEAAAAADRLTRAQKELKFALSDTGKQVAWLKAQTTDANKATVENQRYLKAAEGSYEKINSELKSLISLYKALTPEERASADMGQILVQSIVQYKKELAALDAQLKPHIQQLSAVQKAEEKLAYLQSEEGQRLLDLKAKIREVTEARKQKKAATDPLVEAEKKLAFAQSETNEKLKLYSMQIKEANQIAQLQAQINNSAEGSYNRLSAQYSLNKIKLNQMSAEQRSATESGKALEKETAEIYQQMIKLQEATGNYRLSVGNYKRAWDGLGMAVTQTIRELPAAAVSLNTFFLGISNNIPMLIDEIQRLRAQNKAFQAEGKATVSVVGSIMKALLSWNSILIIVLTILSSFGTQIFAWIANLFKAEKQVLSLTDKLKALNEELANSNGDYGKTVVTVKKLAEEWKSLKTEAEKTQWIKDNATEFSRLDISINNVNDAENVFVDNTEAVLESLKLRAKAEAAMALASKEYEKALLKRNEAELERMKQPSVGQQILGALVADPGWEKGSLANKYNLDRGELIQLGRIATLEEEAKAAENAGDAYFDMADKYTKAQKAMLDAAGIDESHKTSKTKQPRRKRDLTDQINSMDVTVQRKYFESITKLERDEYAKRRKEAFETYNSEVDSLLKTYDKNKQILADEGKLYKELTDEQKAQVENAQEIILKTVENKQKELNQTLVDIERDRQINELELVKETINLRLQAVKQGSEEELKLKLSLLSTEKQIALLQNAKLPAGQQLSAADISAGYNKQVSTTMTDYSMESFDQRQALEEAEFNIIERSEKEITRFKLEQEKERWEQQIALAKAGSLDWTDTQIAAAEATVLGINRQLNQLDDFIYNIGEKGLGTTLLESLGFNDKQINSLYDASNIVIDQLRAIAAAEVELAEAAVEAAEKRVDAAQNALDQELEARNNGYANSVATARKELENEKKNQRQKEKLLQQAQKRQQAIDTVTQTSSLVTASANLWSSFSSIPIVGPALALAAIAAMWTSFAAAKIKASQVSGLTEEYGEGGYEIVEGGSHASGNDVELGVKNSKGKRMVVEGQEGVAVINKRSTRKYKKLIPEVINSINKGVFEEKYLKSFNNGLTPQLLINQQAGSDIDISKIERSLDKLVEQNDEKIFTDGQGRTIIKRKGLTKIIKP